jgi:hypothetical protein
MQYSLVFVWTFHFFTFVDLFVNMVSEFRSSCEVTQLRDLDLRDIANLPESSTRKTPRIQFSGTYPLGHKLYAGKVASYVSFTPLYAPLQTACFMFLYTYKKIQNCVCVWGGAVLFLPPISVAVTSRTVGFTLSWAN